MTFADLGVPSSLVSVLEQQGITTPTPIQAATLDRKSTRLNSSHVSESRMPSSA